MKNAIKKWLEIRTKDVLLTNTSFQSNNMTQRDLNGKMQDKTSDLEHHTENLERHVRALQSDLQLIMNYLGVKKEVIEATEAKKVLVPKDINKLDVTKPLTKKKK
jgi:hypothetical protein